jgi:hypothetical protein
VGRQNERRDVRRVGGVHRVNRLNKGLQIDDVDSEMFFCGSGFTKKFQFWFALPGLIRPHPFLCLTNIFKNGKFNTF